MKKTALQKKWEKISNESGWNPASDSAIIEKIKARNVQMRALKEKKDAKFTTHISSSDFEALKAAAASEGLGYQTFLGSIIHKFLTGRLVDVGEIQKVMDIEVKAKKTKLA